MPLASSPPVLKLARRAPHTTASRPGRFLPAGAGLRLVLGLLLGIAFLAELPAAEPLLLRVLSYNIHHGEGTDGQLDLPRIAKVIGSVQPDLVALQEVDRKVNRSHSVDQPAELARQTGMQVVFGANLALQGGEYGNAILSRFPIRKHQNHPLPRIDASEPRGVLVAEIELPGRSPPLRFFATHFDFRRDDRERRASAALLAELVKSAPDTPRLLAGDLNDTPGSPTLRMVGETWQPANGEPLPTIPVQHPTRQIDFILFGPADGWRVREIRVLDEAIASDHRAIFAELELIPRIAP